MEGVGGLSASLTAHETTLDGVRTIVAQPVGDARGWFARTFDADVLAEAGIDHAAFVQGSQSRSVRGTLRGLHARRELTEAKLVRCAHGAIWDVVVDARPWSPSFLRWETFTLDDREHRQLYIPPGCLHGFQVISEVADVCYRMDARYEPGLDLTVAYDDPTLAIPWPLEEPLLSERDRRAPRLAEIRPQLVEFFGAAAPDRDAAGVAGPARG